MQTPLALLILSTSLLMSSCLIGGDFEVISGGATSMTQGNQTIIENAPNTILNWDHFSIGANEHLHFAQMNAASSVLNRVTGGKMSELHGALTSNGQVFLINPQGVLIGPNALVHTAGFCASTADLLNEDFIQGKDLFFTLSGDGKIVNQGVIRCPEGNIFLIAKDVSNEGKCEANFIGIGSGAQVLIQPQGTARIFIRLEPLEAGEITNTGTLQALAVELKTSSPYEKAIRVSGSIDALCLKEEGGRIFLSTETGGVSIEGTLTAESGNIEIHGNAIALSPSAFIDTSGDNGGNIVIKTGPIGAIAVAPGALICADGHLRDGGTITITAGNTNDFHGHLSAQGGRHGGSIALEAGVQVVPNDIPNRLGITGNPGSFIIRQDNATTIIHDSLIYPVTDAWVSSNLEGGNVELHSKEITLNGDVAINWASKGTLKLVGDTHVVIEDDPASKGAFLCNTSTGGLEIEGNGSSVGEASGVYVYGTLFFFTDGNLVFSGKGETFEGCTFFNSTISTTAISPQSGDITINGIGGVHFHNTQISTLNGKATINGDLYSASSTFFSIGSGTLAHNGESLPVPKSSTLETFSFIAQANPTIYSPLHIDMGLIGNTTQIHNFALLADAMDRIETAGQIRAIRNVHPLFLSTTGKNQGSSRARFSGSKLNPQKTAH